MTYLTKFSRPGLEGGGGDISDKGYNSIPEVLRV